MNEQLDYLRSESSRAVDVRKLLDLNPRWVEAMKQSVLTILRQAKPLVPKRVRVRAYDHDARGMVRFDILEIPPGEALGPPEFSLQGTDVYLGEGGAPPAFAENPLKPERAATDIPKVPADDHDPRDARHVANEMWNAFHREDLEAQEARDAQAFWAGVAVNLLLEQWGAITVAHRYLVGAFGPNRATSRTFSGTGVPDGTARLEETAAATKALAALEHQLERGRPEGTGEGTTKAAEGAPK